MRIKNLLLTGDDGYRAMGIRVLLPYLKDRYNIVIAGTKQQQSGIGAKMTFGKKLPCFSGMVDGVKAYWLDGTPTDIIEFSKLYFPRGFDLVISGINLGANATSGIISSGTFTAAFRALAGKVSRYAIALSWDLPGDCWFLEHDNPKKLSNFAEYPGPAASLLIKKAIENNFWGSRFLNINFPADKTNQVRFTKMTESMDEFYVEGRLTPDKKKFYYPGGTVNKNLPVGCDAGAIKKGFISITPCLPNFTDEKALMALRKKSFKLI